MKEENVVSQVVNKEENIFSKEEIECDHGNFANFEGILKGETVERSVALEGMRSLQK